MKTEYPVEVYTAFVDYLKHIATLSTGSILLIVTFLEKLFCKPEYKICIAISLIAFVITVVATIAAQAGVLENITEPNDIANWAKPLIGISMIVAYLCFLTGLCSLVVFAIGNLY